MVGRLESRYKWSEIFNLNLATFVTKKTREREREKEPQISDLSFRLLTESFVSPIAVLLVSAIDIATDLACWSVPAHNLAGY